MRDSAKEFVSSQETNIKLPFSFRELSLPFDFADISSNDFEKIQTEIFNAWFNHQDVPVLEAIENIMADDPKNSHDFLTNLLAASYLFGKRSYLRREMQTQPRLKETYSVERRKKFAIEDVAFQQDAIIFLLNNKNSQLQELFWRDLRTNQELNRPGESQAGERGILAMEKVVNDLIGSGYQVYLPDSAVDAIEKIDLIAAKDGKIYFIQVKSKSSGRAAGKKYKEEKLDIFMDSVARYSRLTGQEINPLIIEV